MNPRTASTSENLVGEAAPLTAAYQDESSVSKALYERAEQVMPGGNSRHSVALLPYPAYVERGEGCRIQDVEGAWRIDFLNNFTSLILGHRHPRVVEAVTRQLEKGTAFTMPTELDVELAELLVGRVPYIDTLRFCNSGSEAVMLGMKAARAFTGKPKIAKFEGAYHGLYDYAQVSEGARPDNWGDAEGPDSVIETGTPRGVAQDVIVLPWNRIDTCRALLESHKEDLAGVLVDPLPAAIGLIPPRSGFLESLRELTSTLGILFISDEVMSFRLGYHGALHELGIDAEITTFGKIMGGGFPVGAVAGRRDVMEVFDHTKETKVHHGGTFNANPITMAAGLAQMNEMTEDAFARLDALGDYARESFTRMFQDDGIAAQMTGQGSLFIAHPHREELVDYRSMVLPLAKGPDLSQLTHELMARGIVSSPRGLFGSLSTPMTENEVDEFVLAARQSLKALG